MKRPRVIPVLLLQGSGLVKTVRFRDGKYIGDPINAVKIFNDKQCDELVFLDIQSSKVQSAINYKLVEQIASECFMPVAYGGGIRKLSEIEKILSLGIEKVILNSSFLKNPAFVSEAATKFGSSTIVVSIDLKKNFFGKYTVYSHSNQKLPDLNHIALIEKAQQLGAGELMINIVDLEGTMKGYDISLAKILGESVDIPIIFGGGCGSIENISDLLKNTQVSAASAGSFFVYHGKLKGVLISYPAPEIITNLIV